MPRRPRTTPGGYVYHVMNRAAGRLALFESSGDYFAFQQLLSQAQSRTKMRILAYCLMWNHWHFLLWPDEDSAITTFMHWVTTTHARRWVLVHAAVGRGAVYQSRFKAVPVQTGDHLLVVWRYVERNALRANLVSRAEDWRWSSLSMRGSLNAPPLASPPVDRPANWVDYVNGPQSLDELAAVRTAIDRSVPFGDDAWCEETKQSIGWRPQGRPKRGRTPFCELQKGVRPLY